MPIPTDAPPRSTFSRREALALALAAGAAVLPGRPAFAQGVLAQAVSAQNVSAQAASPWASAPHGRARLLDGGHGPQGRLAGIELALDPGFKTYWREPGESGLPAAVDWAGSENLAEARVLWPAPHRSEDAGGVAYGYVGGVLLPVTVVPVDAGRPVALRLALEYGICKDICIPAKADLSLELPPLGDGAPSPALVAALATVPRPVAVGEAADGLAILGARLRAGADGQPVVAVSVRAPADAAPTLFTAAPAGFFLLPPAKPAPEPDGSAVFAVPVLEAPPKRPAQIALVVTLTAEGHRGIEATVRLDTGEWPR